MVTQAHSAPGAWGQAGSLCNAWRLLAAIGAERVCVCVRMRATCVVPFQCTAQKQTC